VKLSEEDLKKRIESFVLCALTSGVEAPYGLTKAIRNIVLIHPREPTLMVVFVLCRISALATCFYANSCHFTGFNGAVILVASSQTS
jgi:hypothetical protein